MRSPNQKRLGERGSALVEFTLGAFVFLTATFGVIEVSRLLWTHNALADATRRAARYAVINPEASEAAVKCVAVYGNPDCTGQKRVNDLDEETHVDVAYTASPVTGVFGYPGGKVTVSVTDYEFNFVVPVVGTSIDLPDYRTTLTAESAGMVPDDIGAEPTPEPTPQPTPLPTPGPTPGPTPQPTPTPAPTPTPQPTPTPLPTPVPTPTPRTCDKGESVSTGCVCKSPMKETGGGKCQ